MKTINECIICGSKKITTQFSKPSATGEEFTLVRCDECGLKFLSPVPDEKEIVQYYKKEYFTKRTDRGYNDYFSGKTKNEIERVFKLNLTDLDFIGFENKLGSKRYALDIGCAAGYFVNYLKKKGWQSQGIDVSKVCVDHARGMKLDVRQGDYLKTNFRKKFNLITLWATIEHLHRPDLVLKKAHEDLEMNGRLFISTCRVDGFNFMKIFGKRWRFFNFPEHMHFFSYRTLKRLLKNEGFEVIAYRTYGSNIGKSGSLIRKISDLLAKKLYLGDMMIISTKKV